MKAPTFNGRTVAVGVFLLVVVVFFVFRGHSEPTRKAGLDPVATQSATASVPVEPVASNPTLDVTRDAVTAWQMQDINARNTALQPLTTPDYYQLASYADPQNVPTSPVASTESALDADGQAAVKVTLEDGTALTVTLVDPELDGTWVVSDIEPA